MADWNSRQYLEFDDLRTRPAQELLARVRLENPGSVMDLGCGPGNSTELLVQRFSNSKVCGLDSSPNMLDEARSRVPGADFVEGDIGTWQADSKLDLIFANASLQWVVGHKALIPTLLEQLIPKGVLAVQMPNNLSEPSHELMRQTALEGPWSDKLSNAAQLREKIGSFSDYYNHLIDHCDVVDIWSTSYAHILENADAIVDWLRSTGLRPFLAPLNEEEQLGFIESYLLKIKLAYPPLKDGRVILRFPRIFIVAQKKFR